MFEVLINFFIENPGVILVGGMAFLVMMVGRQWADEKPKIPKTPWPPLFLIIILVSMMYFLGSSIGNSHNNYEQEAYKLINECERELPRNQHCEAYVDVRVLPPDPPKL